MLTWLATKTTRPQATKKVGTDIAKQLYNPLDQMYTVKNKTQEQQFESLDLAMAHARLLGEFVTITGNGMEIVGVFGADTVKDGLCPDGVAYTWMKRRSQ